MSGIKILVCCHRSYPVPEYPFLLPIQVGSALTDKRFPGFLYDDSGENISCKNPSYCELTAQYWAWKNMQASHIGFFHYRRYLYPGCYPRGVYCIRKAPPTSKLLERLGYEKFPQIIEQYDMILPRGEDMHMSVREHYASAPWHHGRDMEAIQNILREQHPQMEQAMEQYLSGTICYFGNIYIMSWDTFCNYSAWLFPALAEFDQRANLSGYSAQERRVDGYLAERMLGIYYTYYKSALKTLELPRVHFYDGQEFAWYRVQNMLLPPGSRRRSAAKRWKRRVLNDPSGTNELMPGSNCGKTERNGAEY